VEASPRLSAARYRRGDVSLNTLKTKKKTRDKGSLGTKEKREEESLDSPSL
jgi:hypothetical protein